jgi:hypothetical protein
LKKALTKNHVVNNTVAAGIVYLRISKNMSIASDLYFITILSKIADKTLILYH